MSENNSFIDGVICKQCKKITPFKDAIPYSCYCSNKCKNKDKDNSPPPVPELILGKTNNEWLFEELDGVYIPSFGDKVIATEDKNSVEYFEGVICKVITNDKTTTITVKINGINTSITIDNPKV
jgi:hypothetical protein